MRKDQVGTATVQVDGGTELAQRQGRTLDVPARPARSPQGLPKRLALSGWLPQHEVERMALVGIVDIAAAFSRERDHLLPAVMSDFTERRERLDGEADVATGC